MEERGKGGQPVGNLAEIKRRIDSLKAILAGAKERVAGLAQSMMPEIKEKLKREGTRLGIGSGLSVLGLTVLAAAAVYLVAALILVLDLALERLWLSALIMVAALFLLGGLAAGIGAAVARRSARRMQEIAEKANGEAAAAVKELASEVRGELVTLQELARREAGERRRQALQALETLRRLAPAIIVLLLLLALIRRRRRRKRLKLTAEAPVVIREVIREEGE